MGTYGGCPKKTKRSRYTSDLPHFYVATSQNDRYRHMQASFHLPLLLSKVDIGYIHARVLYLIHKK